jgi:hypothetical protein
VGLPVAAAADAPAEMEWTVLDRFGGDPDGKGLLIDSSPLTPAELDVFAVRVRPSAALCAEAERAVWRVDGRLARPELEAGPECAVVVQVRGEGPHTVKVLARDRAEIARPVVEDELIVAIGDSVAAGEGNPAEEGPLWLDKPCHRSAAAGFEVAARHLGLASARRSVTFVSFACSGAEVEAGLLGPYAGVDPDRRRAPYLPQVERLRRIVAARGGPDEPPPVDAILLSVGANDVRFSGIVKECSLPKVDCSEGRDAALQERLDALDGNYDRLDGALEKAAPETPVLITEYFDPTRDGKGEFCARSVGFTSRAEAAWAYNGLLRPLNGRVATAAVRNGWKLVGGIASAFERHGYCVKKSRRWVRRLEESAFYQRDVLGTLHPSEPGHREIARQVAVPLDDLLDFGAPPLLPEAEEDDSDSDANPIALGGVLVLWPPLGVVLLLSGASSTATWILLACLLLPVLVLLLVRAPRALLLLRPTWSPDPAGDTADRPDLSQGLKRPSPTARQLLGVGFGVAMLLVGVVLIAGLVGRAILWLRFWSARLPADQAVDGVSAAELVSTGAVALAIFFGLGLIAAALAWLLDSKGRWVRTTRRGLVGIGLVEVLAAVWIGDFRTDQALQLLAGLLLAGLLLYYLVEKALAWGTEEKDRRTNLEDPPPFAEELWTRLKARAQGLVKRSPGRGGRLLRLVPFLGLGVTIWFAFQADSADRTLVVLGPYVLAAILFTLPGGMAEPGVRWTNPLKSALEVPRIALALTGFTVILVLLIRDELWLAGVAAVAIVLGLLCLAIAAGSKDRFGPYGLAVLVSVPIFAGAATFLHGLDSPELQPVAVVMDNGETVCGAYVGEDDGRLWIGRLVLDERAGAHRPRRGAIGSVDADQVATRALGPLEPVDLVEARALELRDGLLDERRDMDEAKRTPSCEPPELAPKVSGSWQRRLAESYQPELVIDRRDRFWPIPVRTLFSIRDRRAAVCRRVTDDEQDCLRLRTPGEFPWIGGEGESLEYPAADDDVDEQHDQIVEALGSADPEASATEYFLVNREKKGVGPISVQYWFFYSFNYLPIPGGFIEGGFHEGDFETVGVLLSARTKQPRYVWMARHDEEGRAFPWTDETLERPENHPRAYVARGSHASYENCHGQVRPVEVKKGLIDDHPTCEAKHQLHLMPEATPLIDLSRVGWACWHGRFGHINGGLGIYERTPYLIGDAPESPLWQQEFGEVKEAPCRGITDPGGRDGLGEEVLEEEGEEGIPAQLRKRAGRLEHAIDDCADWETPAPSGIYMVVCNEGALDAYVKSGLEDPGEKEVRIEGSEPGALNGPTVLPAVRRNRAGVYLDDWRISAERPARVSVYASCPSKGRVVAARFENVLLRPDRPLRIRDRSSGGAWVLTAPDGEPIVSAVPVPTKAKDGLLVEGTPEPDRILGCG